MSGLPCGLPKAKLIQIYIRKTWRFTPWLARFRCANFGIVWLGPFQITCRMPWLKRSARQLHPHLFSDMEK